MSFFSFILASLSFGAECLGPFLYKPKAKVQVNAMDTAVAHVSVRVPYVLRMTVENPLDLPLKLKNLELKSPEGWQIKSEVLAEILLPPLCKQSMFFDIDEIVLSVIFASESLVCSFLFYLTL
jgi:hypothetical protein